MSAKKKVLVAMSGGVDSSVTALLLKEQGYEVAGAHMRLRYGSEFDKKKSDTNVEFVRNTTELLDIPFHLVTLEGPFEENVISPFIEEYKKGITPNPCILCNIKIKFGRLYEEARNLGFDYLATGHYTHVDSLPNGRRAVFASTELKKDQSYYLYGLSQDVLNHTLFPLSGFQKSKVREIARQNGLPAAEREESQEICFVQNDYRSFLAQEGINFTSGNIVDKEGNVLGQHEGRENYTIGQRRGLNVAVGRPLYVIDLLDNGDVVVGDPGDLDQCAFDVTDFQFHGLAQDEMTGSGVKSIVQVRYKATPVEAMIYPSDDGQTYHVETATSPFAITPGQAAVFYEPEKHYILGGGKII